MSINTENDAAGYIHGAFMDAIKASGLPLQLSREVSLSSRFRTDFLVLRMNGFPVGVIEVKKPDDQELTQEPKIFGELFDYMMFLKNTYNLSRVVGMLSRYSDWYVCWLGDPSSPSSPSPPLMTPPHGCLSDFDMPATPFVLSDSKPRT